MIYYKLTKTPKIEVDNIIEPIFYDIKDNNDKFIYINKLCYKYIIDAKQEINDEFEYWDIFKKITNPYEYIHTPYNNKQSVSKLKPLSRAYYKMIEIIKMFDLLQDYKDSFINSFHLAEGPGGFIEAVADTRKNPLDIYHGISLINKSNNIIPGWNKINSVLRKYPNIVIEKGKSGDGDLYKTINYTEIKDKYADKMDFITADGGFDFSVDFNKQEIYAIQLIFTQIIYALTLQKNGGVFIIKVFDCFSKSMVDMIYLLSSCYDEVYITKPNTSRVANSEKYIVCRGYNKIDDKLLVSLINIYNKLIINQEKEPQTFMSSFFKGNHTIFFKNEIKEINSLFGQRQIENIYNTIMLIKKCNRKNNNRYSILQNKHVNLCIEWCNEHNIPYNDFKKRNLFLED